MASAPTHPYLRILSQKQWSSRINQHTSSLACFQDVTAPYGHSLCRVNSPLLDMRGLDRSVRKYLQTLWILGNPKGSKCKASRICRVQGLRQASPIELDRGRSRTSQAVACSRYPHMCCRNMQESVHRILNDEVP